MTLKEFKQELINYTRTILPDEYSKVLRVPGSAASNDFTLRSTKEQAVKDFCQKEFSTTTKSFKLDRNESLFGEEILESFKIDLNRLEDPIEEVFPGRNIDELLATEKEKLKHNLDLALFHPKSDIKNFIEKAAEKGLIQNQKTMDNQWDNIDNQLKVWEEFLAIWPKERIETMAIEEYTNLDKNSFCYWLESITETLGSIWGGSSYKFGIYKKNDPKLDSRDAYKSDGVYAWVGKYGTDRETAFEAVRAEILKVVNAALDDDLQVVNSVDLGKAYKWKIAALYHKNIPLIYKKEAISFLADYYDLGTKNEANHYYSLAKQKRENENIIELSFRLWSTYEQNKDKQPIEKDAKWYQLARVIRSIDQRTYVNQFFDTLKYLLEYHELDNEDPRVYAYALSNKNRVQFTVGSTYCLALEKKGNQHITFFYADLDDYDALNKEYNSYGSIKKRVNKGKEIGVWGELPTGVIDHDELKESIARAIGGELSMRASMHRTSYQHKHNPWIIKAALDQHVLDALLNENFENEIEEIMDTPSNKPLNQILFGPPGTGKTFNTINEALKVVNPEYYEEHQEDRDKLREEYNRLLIKDWDKDKSGRIAFVTFHQSYSYEDFVEGIKPFTTDEKEVYYDIEDGIFKKICQRSKDESKSEEIKNVSLVNLSEGDWQDAFFYKISLGDSTKFEDKEIYDYCIKNNKIAVGFGWQIDLSGLTEAQINEEIKKEGLPSGDAKFLNYFIHYLKVGNYVIVGNGNSHFRAIGRVTGEYEYIKESEIPYNHFRSVEWVYYGDDIPISDIYDRNLQQQTIYKLDKNGIKKDFFVPQNNAVADVKINDDSSSNYVLIIDEINRGNVSSIFGELITLLEKDKRLGANEALELILPYSKKLFGVPGNVYVLGTMNTADRSIETLDTALRRRFTFIEKPPIPNVIEEYGASEGKIGSIDLVMMLSKINERIEKLIDKDHCIGHAYFMSVKSLDDLKDTFKNKVIPLLQEYFFGDYGKIGLVLGGDFVQKQFKDQDFEFASFDDYDSAAVDDLKQRPIYSIHIPEKEESYISIYK